MTHIQLNYFQQQNHFENIPDKQRQISTADKLTTSSGSSSRSSYCVVTDPASTSRSTTSPMSAGRIFCKHRCSTVQFYTSRICNMHKIHQLTAYNIADRHLLSTVVIWILYYKQLIVDILMTLSRQTDFVVPNSS